MAYVYRHIRLDKNEPFYIGIGTCENDRNYTRAYNFDRRHRNKIWYDIYNKTKIEVEILFDDVSDKFAKNKEIEFVSIYKRIADGGTLANITLGGDGMKGFKNPKLSERNKKGLWKGKKHSEQTKLKMSLIAKSQVRTKEHKKNISKSKIGVYDGVKNPRYKGEIYAYDLNGCFIKSFTMLKDVAEWTNTSISSIIKYVDGKKYKSHRGIVYTRKKLH